jgi:hypothetical protein
MRWMLFLIFVCIGAMTPHPLESPFTASLFVPIRAEATESQLRTKEIQLLVSVAWDGPNVNEYNLQSFKSFRDKFSNIPVSHFVSPSYFTSTQTAYNKSVIQSLYRLGDQIGLAVAPWKSVVTGAGVAFRSTPTFWGPTLTQTACSSDCGGEVPLNVYTPQEVRSILSNSIKVMDQQGFKDLKGMQITGWMATPEIIAAANDIGIEYDFSMVTPSLLSEQLREFPIFSWVNKLWPNADVLSQPGILPSHSQRVTEVPQSMASLDYVTVEQMSLFLERFVASESKNPLTYHIALNADSIHMTLPKLELVLQNVFKQASEGKFQLSMHKIPEMAWSQQATNMPLVSDSQLEKIEALSPAKELSH